MSWQDAIPQIVTGVVGVTGTLGGTVLSQYFSRKERRDQAERERNILLRSKAELLYAELESLVQYSKNNISAALRAQHLGESAKVDVVLPTDRVECLIAVYFPSLLPTFAKVDKETMVGLQPLMDNVAAAGAKSDRSAFQAAMSEVANHIALSAARMSGALKRELSSVVARLT